MLKHKKIMPGIQKHTSMAKKPNSSKKSKTIPKSGRSSAKKRSGFKSSRFSVRSLVIFALIFAAVGGFLLWKTFAASQIATVEAENLRLPSGASIVDDQSASGTKAVKYSYNGVTTGSVSLPSIATSVTLNAKGVNCNGAWQTISLAVDGKSVLTSVSVNSTNWKSLSATVNLAAGSHTLNINNSGWQRCGRYLYIDAVSFYGGNVTPAPTVSLSASPTSLSSGQASTLLWSSSNASSCTASGMWSGAQPTSGNTSTGPLTSTSSYTLTCTGAGGTTSASVTITIGAPPPPSGTGYDATILNDKPVAYWAMNSTGGTESDLSGNGNTGTYKNGTPPQLNMPNNDKAVDFNGRNQYLTVPSNSSMSIPTTQQLTWESWIKPDVLAWSTVSDPYGYGYVDWMGKCQNYSPTCEWESRMYSSTHTRSSRMSAYVFNPSAGLGSGADWQPASNVILQGHWLHIVGEYQTKTTPSGCNVAYPGSIDIWVNGVKWSMASHLPTGCMSQYQIIPRAGSSPFNVGTMAFDSYFPGAIGKVAIYNFLLSQTQISNHYTTMTGLQPSGSCGNTCTTQLP